jgi:phospholipid-binding lipoprotein MlaA
MTKRRFWRALICSTIAASICGCVTLPPNAPRSPQDPWERWNRGVYKFNDAIDRGVAKPVARTYLRVVPHPIRKGVTNFFSNLEMTTVMVNDALQGKLRAAATDLGRFLLNSTVGVAGLLDPATQIGMAHNDEDFGQTLGRWGVHPGPFLELPLLGPSDLRDGPALLVDTYTNPRYYLVKNTYVKYGMYGINFIDRRANLLYLDPTLQAAFDPYVFVRDAYIARRAYLVSDGKLPAEAPLVDPDAPAPTNEMAPDDRTAPTPSPTPSPTPETTPPPQP